MTLLVHVYIVILKSVLQVYHKETDRCLEAMSIIIQTLYGPSLRV